MPNALFSFLAWTFVPTYATQFLQGLLYSVTIRAGDPKPQKGSPQSVKHYKRIYVGLLLCYFAFTVYEVFYDIQLKGDFYRALDAPHDVNDKLLKSKFRRLAAQHHPDKAGQAGVEGYPQDYFLFLKHAEETLIDPVKRFAYDRFGPDVLKTQLKTPTIKDYVNIYSMSNGPTYVGSALVMVVLGFLGQFQYGRFWRYLAFGILILLEVETVTRPYSPWILRSVLNPLLTTLGIFPPLLQFQFLQVARKVTFNVFIAISQLGPIVSAGNGLGPTGDVDITQLATLEHISRATEAEASHILAVDMTPYINDATGKRQLKEQISRWLVQNTIQADPEVWGKISAAMTNRGKPNT